MDSHGSRDRITCLCEDQDASRSSVALMNNVRLRRPVVLIVDRDYDLFPYRMVDLGKLPDVRYAVLGWYMVTDYWGIHIIIAQHFAPLLILPCSVEPEPSITLAGALQYYMRLKFAFRWLPNQEELFFLRVPPSISTMDGKELARSNIDARAVNSEFAQLTCASRR